MSARDTEIFTAFANRILTGQSAPEDHAILLERIRALAVEMGNDFSIDAACDVLEHLESVAQELRSRLGKEPVHLPYGYGPDHFLKTIRGKSPRRRLDLVTQYKDRYGKIMDETGHAILESEILDLERNWVIR